MTFPFPVFIPAVADAGATVSFVSSNKDNVNRSTYTFAAQNIGTAAAGRRVIVGVHAAATVVISSVTIGGVPAASVVQQTSTNLRGGLFILELASGSTADIVVNLNTNGNRCSIVVWEAHGLTSSTATDTAGEDVVPLSQSLTIDPNGVAVGFAVGYATSAQSWTWTGLTEDVDDTVNASTNYEAFSGASLSSPGGETPTVTATKTGADTNDLFVLAAFA